MRVALVTRDYPPSIGGVATHVYELTRALRALGVDADLFVGRTNAGTLTVPLFHRLGKYDIVHAQSSPYGALVSGTPLVITVHAPVLAEWKSYSMRLQLESFPAFLMEKMAFRKAKAILAVSALTAKDLQTKYGVPRKRVAVIGNGVDHKRFHPSDDQRAKNRILLVSRLEPRKNVEESLRALAMLSPGSYEAQIAGDGSQREKLERLAGSLQANIKFLGKVGEESLPSLYRQASIFLSSSLSEGFGLTVLEAMSAGCAVVVSDISAHRNLVRNRENGLLYQSESELESFLKSLVSDSALARRLGTAAALTAMQYSWDSVARRVLEVYRRVLGE